MFIHHRSSLENYTRFQTNGKNPTLWDGTYLYGLYKGASVEINEITDILLTSSICRNVSRTELPQNH